MQVSAERDVQPSIIKPGINDDLGGVFLVKCPNHSRKESWESESKQTSFLSYALMCGLIL